MKHSLLAIAVIGFVMTAGCALQQTPPYNPPKQEPAPEPEPAASTGLVPKTFSVDVNPELSLSPSRKKVDAELRLILDPAVKNPFKISRSQGYVLIEVNNFRETVQSTLKQALTPQFSSIVLQETEQGEGLELVVIHAIYPDPVDVMAYHLALMNNGKLVHEFKGSTLPVTRAVQGSVDGWQERTSKLYLEVFEENILDLAERVRDELMINDKLDDFWKGYQK